MPLISERGEWFMEFQFLWYCCVITLVPEERRGENAGPTGLVDGRRSKKDRRMVGSSLEKPSDLFCLPLHRMGRSKPCSEHYEGCSRCFDRRNSRLSIHRRDVQDLRQYAVFQRCANGDCPAIPASASTPGANRAFVAGVASDASIRPIVRCPPVFQCFLMCLKPARLCACGTWAAI